MTEHQPADNNIDVEAPAVVSARTAGLFGLSGGEIRVQTRTPLVTVHFHAAQRSAQQSHAVESSAGSGSFDFPQYRQHCCAAVVLAAAAMDAHKNQLLYDLVAQPRRLRMWDARNEAKALGKDLEGVSDCGPIKESAGLIRLLQVEDLDLTRGTAADNALALFKLRDALMHYWPEWSDEQQEHLKVTALLKGRYALSPLAPEVPTSFPDHYIGFGCARWAVRAARAFILMMEERTASHRRGTGPIGENDLPLEPELF